MSSKQAPRAPLPAQQMGRKPPAPRGCSLSLGPLLGPSERRESPVCGGGCLEAVPKCVPQDPLLRVYGGSTLEAGDPGGALPSTPLLCDRPLTCESGAAGAGAATGAGLPAAASRRPPWSAHSSSLADASLPTGGCAPGCLCSAQRSSWLLTASLRFLLWVVLEIRVLHYTGQPL